MKPILSRIFKDFWDLCIILLVLFLSMGSIAFFDIVSAFNLPNQGKYKSFVERSKQVPESEIESSRSAKTGRKASENKRPWLADSFLDMENLVDPMADLGGSPKYLWPDGTRQEVPPGSVEWPLLAGCALSAQPTIDVADGKTKYNVRIGILHGLVQTIKVKGPASISGNMNLFAASRVIPVTVYENATHLTPIIVSVTTLSVRKNPEGKFPGSCSAKTLVLNETECECDGGTPTLYFSGTTTIAPGGTLGITVDSGGYACPPYTWTVSGTGYTILPATTENDLEYVTLTSAAAPCGAGYGPYATVTVTDACGATDTAKFLNTGGAWGASVWSGNPTGWSACSGAGCDPGTPPGGSSQTFYNDIYAYVYSNDVCDRGTATCAEWPAAAQAYNPPYAPDYSFGTSACFGESCEWRLYSLAIYEWSCP